MRKLLKDSLELLKSVEWVYSGNDYCPGCGSTQWVTPTPRDEDAYRLVHLPNCKLVSSVEGLKTQLAALSPEASHAESILAHADGLEEEGDARAEPIRAIINGVRGYWKTQEVSVMVAIPGQGPPKPRAASEPVTDRLA